MSSFALKLTALALMLIDHTGAVLIAAAPGGGSNGAFLFFRLLGRASCPIYAFLTAEGCVRTADIKKYFLRLTLFAFISEISFNLFHTFAAGQTPSVFCIEAQNILFTWALAVLGVTCLKKAGRGERAARKRRERAARFVFISAAAAAAVSAQLLNTDYGALGVLSVYVFYVTKGFSFHKSKGFFAGFVVCLSLSVITFAALYFPLLTAAYAAVSFIFISMYNGRRGFSEKYFFYAFYPAHLSVLFLLGVSMRG